MPRRPLGNVRPLGRCGSGAPVTVVRPAPCCRSRRARQLRRRAECWSVVASRRSTVPLTITASTPMASASSVRHRRAGPATRRNGAWRRRSRDRTPPRRRAPFGEQAPVGDAHQLGRPLGQRVHGLFEGQRPLVADPVAEQVGRVAGIAELVGVGPGIREGDHGVGILDQVPRTSAWSWFRKAKRKRAVRSLSRVPGRAPGPRGPRRARRRDLIERTLLQRGVGVVAGDTVQRCAQPAFTFCVHPVADSALKRARGTRGRRRRRACSSAVGLQDLGEAVEQLEGVGLVEAEVEHDRSAGHLRHDAGPSPCWRAAVSR